MLCAKKKRKIAEDQVRHAHSPAPAVPPAVPAKDSGRTGQHGSKEAPCTGVGRGAGCGSSCASLSLCTETGRAALIHPVCTISCEKNPTSPPISSWFEFLSGCVGWGGHPSLKSESSGCWSPSQGARRRASPCEGAMGAPRHAAPGLRCGPLRRGVSTGAVPKGAVGSCLPKEMGCGWGSLQRAEIPRGCSVVLRAKTGWWWAGSNQVFLAIASSFAELTPINGLINLVTALTHSKSLSILCLGLPHAQRPAAATSSPRWAAGEGWDPPGCQGVPGPGDTGAGPVQPPPSPADWWVLPFLSSA